MDALDKDIVTEPIPEPTLDPFTKPVHKSILGKKSKTAFKGASNCPTCGKPSLMRMKTVTTCLSCGYEE